MVWHQYLADDCVLASTVRSRWHLRSADTMKLVVQRSKTVIGTRAFAVAAATVWNRLPADIRTSTCTVQTFAQKLKTVYASRRIWGFFILHGRNWLIIIIIIIIWCLMTGHIVYIFVIAFYVHFCEINVLYLMQIINHHKEQCSRVILSSRWVITPTFWQHWVLPKLISI